VGRRALLVALVLLAAGLARADERWSERLERELMSPYCPGRSLVECPSPQATELRLWIQAQERAGVPRESVEARLFQQFGDQLRHGPRAEGFGLWAYLVPAGALLAGLGLVLVFLRRQSRPAPASPATAPPRDPTSAQHARDPGSAATARDPASAATARDLELERRLDEELGATS
jgi:cytochrome c-type biogenesis protein CcmH/NrfF